MIFFQRDVVLAKNDQPPVQTAAAIYAIRSLSPNLLCNLAMAEQVSRGLGLKHTQRAKLLIRPSLMLKPVGTPIMVQMQVGKSLQSRIGMP